MSAQRLPMEIILHIINSVADDSRTIYCPSDPVTKTLLAFTLVCRATHTAAVNHLRRQCMYIDDQKRLADCVAYLKATNHLVPEYNPGNIDDAKVIPPGARLCPITSLYLDGTGDGTGTEHTMTHIVDLWALVGSTLTRLILGIPAQVGSEEASELYMMAYMNVRTAHDSYIESFLSLTELRDFVYVGDSTSCMFSPHVWGWGRATLPINEGPHPWRFWPNLRRLALYDEYVDHDFWQSVRKAEQLTTLTLVGSHWHSAPSPKSAIFQALVVDPATSEIGTIPADLSRSINVIVAEDAEADGYLDVRQKILGDARTWPLIDPDNLIKLSLFDLPSPINRKSPSFTCAREYMRAAALRDEIWDWEGEQLS